MQVSTLYDIGDAVKIRGTTALQMSITAISFREATGGCLYITYELSWVMDGRLHSEWVAEPRIEPWVA